MKFLIDAQLPTRLEALLGEHGHDVVHTSALPDGNRSTDRQICELADTADRIVVTKDADFRNSHLLSGSPQRLLVVATGNASNQELLHLVYSNLAALERAFVDSGHVELRPEGLIVHPR